MFSWLLFVRCLFLYFISNLVQKYQVGENTNSESIYQKNHSSLLYLLTSLAITCGHPGNPANGRTNGSEFNLNDVVNFTCNKGYILNGNARAQCRLNGQWSSPLPVCKGNNHICCTVICIHFNCGYERESVAGNISSHNNHKQILGAHAGNQFVGSTNNATAKGIFVYKYASYICWMDFFVAIL